MAKKESQDGKPKKGLPRLMELAMTQKAPMVGGMILSALATVASFLPYLAIYFIIQEIVGAYPDFSTLDVSKVLGYGGSRRSSLECTALHCICGAFPHCGLWHIVSMQNRLCIPYHKTTAGLPFEDGQWQTSENYG